MLPLAGTLPTWVPLTYRRRVLPSYVLARWLQVFNGSAAVPAALSYVPPMRTAANGCG